MIACVFSVSKSVVCPFVPLFPSLTQYTLFAPPVNISVKRDTVPFLPPLPKTSFACSMLSNVCTLLSSPQLERIQHATIPSVAPAIDTPPTFSYL